MAIDVTLLLTPGLAGDLLASVGAGVNPLSASSEVRVADYAAVMAAGDWAAGSVVIVDCHGRLVDGWHRCWSVVRSDTAIDVTQVAVPWSWPSGTVPE